MGKLTSCEAEGFHQLCLFLESLHLKKKEDKLQVLEYYLKRFDTVCDLFPLFRLLLPSVDHDRSTYGLKETNLAKLYGEMLALPEGQKQRLLRWKDPALQEGYRCAAGDFASVLYSVAEARATVKPGESTLTIGDVNAALDRIHNTSDAGEKRTQLLDLARRASAIEQKWIAKIILKDLKVGFSHESVLKRFHPDAMELYNRSSMLKQVLDTIRLQYLRARDGNLGGADSAAAQELGGLDNLLLGAPGMGSGGNIRASEGILFSKFKPMLAQRLTWDQLPKVMDGSITWSCEAKYDGERIMVHVDLDGQRVELYTRNAIDYTSLYAPTMRRVFLGGVAGRQAVIDGEMLAFDEAEQVFVPFGSNRTVAQAGDPNRHLCFVAFDLLYYMDEEGQVWDLRRTKFQARRELLEKVIQPKDRWLEVAPSMITTSASEVQARLEGAMDNREEGLVIKDVSSRYWFNARKKGWYKIKPEYEGISETLDFLVIGAYFGDSQKRRGGLGTSTDLADNVSQFLLAALQGNGKEGGDRVVTVARVGTGFSMEQLKEIRARIRPHLRRYDPHRAPVWLGSWRGAGKAKPDAILDSPTHGFVMEIRAAEIVPSDDYEFGHTLRFPRAVVPIREDKDWCDACTESDLHEFLKDGRGLLTARRVRTKVEVQSDNDGEDTDDGKHHDGPAAKRRKSNSGGAAPRLGLSALRRGRSFGVLEGFRGTDTTTVPVASRLLRGAEVFVLNGDKEYSKADLEAYVVRHGGRNMQNYIKKRTSLVVAASASDLRSQNLARTAQVDIVKYGYLFQSETEGRLLPLQPCFLLSTSADTAQRFKHAFDRWGDAFYEDITPETLQESMEDVAEADLKAISQECLARLSAHPRFLKCAKTLRKLLEDGGGAEEEEEAAAAAEKGEGQDKGEGEEQGVGGEGGAREERGGSSSSASRAGQALPAQFSAAVDAAMDDPANEFQAEKLRPSDPSSSSSSGVGAGAGAAAQAPAPAEAAQPPDLRPLGSGLWEDDPGGLASAAANLAATFSLGRGGGGVSPNPGGDMAVGGGLPPLGPPHFDFGLGLGLGGDQEYNNNNKYNNNF